MSPNVLMFSPGFPEDIGYFTQGLAEVGANVYGIGDAPLGGLKPEDQDKIRGLNALDFYKIKAD